MENAGPLTQGESRKSPIATPYRSLSVALDHDGSFDGLLSDFDLYDDSRQSHGSKLPQQRFTSLQSDNDLRVDNQTAASDTVSRTDHSTHLKRSESVDSSSIVGYSRRNQAADPDRNQYSPSIVSDKANVSPTETPRQYWTSVWLRRYTLVAFAALFASLAAALVILWYMNKKQNGFTTVLGTNHYAWTYGPTAILVVVLSLWRQVEYHCKMLQPWRELRKGSAEAEQSMLLDYLSPIQITSFVKAVRYRHAPVAASIAGFAVLKAVVLVSTGLLVLTPVRVTEPRLTTLSTLFDSQPFWDTIPGAPYAAWDRSGPDRMLYHNVSAHPVHSYLNTFREDAVPLTNMAGDTVLQSIDPVLETDVLGITIDVDAFVPNVTCEIAHADWSPHGSPQYGYMEIQLNSASCSEPGGHIVEQASKLCDEDCPDETSYDIFRVNCSQGAIPFRRTTELTIVDEHTLDDMRFAMLVSNLTFERYHSTGDNTTTIATPRETAAVICKVDYTMDRSVVTQNLTAGTKQAITTQPMPHLSNLTGLMLGEIIYSAMFNFKYLYLEGELQKPGITSYDSISRVAFYNIMLQTMDGEQSINRFLSVETLLSSTKQTMSGLAAHVIRESFLTPSISQRNGTVLRSEERLEIGAVSLWLMVAGLFVMIILTSFVMHTTSQNLVPRDPGLLSTDAIILASDASLRKLLTPCNAMRTEELDDALRHIQFSTPIDTDLFRITSMRDGSVEDFDKSRRTKSKSRPWIPLFAKGLMVCLTLTISLTAVVAIEVVHRISSSDGGFLVDGGSEDRVSFLSRYLSALVVLLVATCYNSLDFTIASFAPYSSLRCGPVPVSKGIDFQILGSTPPVALFRSVRGGHVGPSLSNIAGMIGSVLTIVASGLWVVNRNLAVEQPIVASLADRWDYEWRDSATSGDGGAGVILDQLQHGSAVMPDTIWNNVVLPHVTDIRSISSSPLAQSMGSTLVQNHTLLVKGLRPLLDCEAVAEEHISVLPNTTIMAMMQVLAPLPTNCHYGGPNGSNSYYNFSVGLPRGSKGGYLYDLRLSPTGNADLPQDELPPPENPFGCPSIGAILAHISDNRTGHDQITVLLCSQQIQQGDVNVTYQGSSLQYPKISADPTPVMDESSVRTLNNGTTGFDMLPYRILSYLNDNLTSFPQDTLNSGDMFNAHLVYGPNGTALDNMIGTANQHNFIQAVQSLYVKYMCLVIDMRFRVPVTAKMASDPQQGSDLVAGTSYSFASRLRLNTASKLALQIMMGSMFVLGAFAYLLTDLRGTLPRKPYTIASRMALLAGSDLCDGEQSRLPPDALWKSRKELDKVLDGWLFSLGWWQQSESSAASASEDAEFTADTSDGGSIKEKNQRSRRFGIDIGVPEQLGFRKTKWSSLRQRLGQRRV